MTEDKKPATCHRQRRKQKQQYRSSHNQRKGITPRSVFVCVDWGASYWRQYTSTLGISPPEPSLVVYNRETKDLLTGQKAANAWLPNSSHVCFENLKKLFDEESGFLQEESDRIRKMGLDINIELILEAWWQDRMGPLMKRTGPEETITFAIAHPAYFSPRSVQRLRDFFAKSRDGRQFKVIVSEESTAALHGSRYSGFRSGDIVIVVDGGKSTIDCACLEISSDDRSLTTIIFKTKGLGYGGDFINQSARNFAEPRIKAYQENASSDIRELMTANSFEQAIEAWWQGFEFRCKRNLDLARYYNLLDQIVLVPVPGLMRQVEKASEKLAEETKKLIDGLILEVQQITARSPTSILCVGGYCQSKELRSVLRDLKPSPQFEKGDTDGNDVINGLRSLALHPERAEWQFSPQHYLITQDRANKEREALLLCVQGECLAKDHERVCLQSPAEEVKMRKEKYKTPYHKPGHFVAIEVSLESGSQEADEKITYEIELRTAELLKVRPNEQGFLVSDLEDTTLLQHYSCVLPDHYRDLFRQQTTISIYICISTRGQDIVVTAMRPRNPSKIAQMEWMTMPEILGTFGRDSIEIFETSVQVTTASKQSIVPCFKIL